MIEDRHEELASLYVFDLLEGAERDQFESDLARDGELQTLVRELKETACRLVYAAPTTPAPTALKGRVLGSVANRVQGPVDNVIRPSPSVWRILPWAAAACLTLVSIWLGQRYAATRTEVATLKSREEMATISLQSTQQQLEAERILGQRRFQTVEQQLAALNRDLGEARSTLTDREQRLAEARSQLTERERQLGETHTLLANAQTQLAARDQQMAALTARVSQLTVAANDAGAQLGDAKLRIAQLTDELKSQGDLATLKITALASMLKNLPQAQAIAVWDPKKQEGILDVQKLPALAANEDYQIWVVDPQYPIPVDGGVFTVEPTSGSSRIKFTAKQPVSVINAFAVTRERKGGVPKAEGPFVLLGK